jgi:hypothetical protein
MKWEKKNLPVAQESSNVDDSWAFLSSAFRVMVFAVSETEMEEKTYECGGGC